MSKDQETTELWWQLWKETVFRKEKVEYLKLKIKMDEFKSRLDLAEGRINKMEEKSKEILQNT